MTRKYFLQLSKIFFAMVIAYMVSGFLNNDIFIANSPQIRADWKEYLASKVTIQSINPLAWIFGSKEDKELAARKERLKASLIPVAKGVRAASEGNVSYIEYNIDEVEWAEITYILSNGKTVKIRYPKGMTVPGREVFERR